MFFLVFHCAAKKKLKPHTPKNQKKTLSFFGFSQFFNYHFIQKNTITLSFFVFSRSRPKKPNKPGQNQKNQTWASDQTFSEKFCFFVFWFSRVFFWFCHWGFPKESPNIVFCWFFRVFFLIFPMVSLPKSRHILFFCFQLVLIVCTATTHKTS